MWSASVCKTLASPGSPEGAARGVSHACSLPKVTLEVLSVRLPSIPTPRSSSTNFGRYPICEGQSQSNGATGLPVRDLGAGVVALLTRVWTQEPGKESHQVTTHSSPSTSLSWHPLACSGREDLTHPVFSGCKNSGPPWPGMEPPVLAF